MKNVLKLFRWGLTLCLILTLGMAGLLAAAYITLAPGLPSVETLRDIRLQVPLRVYTRDGRLVAEYGEKRREPVRIHDVPRQIIQAFLAAEDDRFFAHPGVDYQGILRAAVNLARTREKSQGGSTITMQVARNFFLEPEKTYTRKLREIFLSLRIERELSKEEILELYLNKIYLGQRAYGIGAASRIYYGKDLADLGLAQIAMLAGLPKAPSKMNPISNPERARIRRNYVLDRMLALGYITAAEHAEAAASPITARLQGLAIETDARWLAEMARSEMTARYGEEEAYTGGYRLYLSIDGRLQQAADSALRTGLLAYDRRHGYRGPEGRFDLTAENTNTALDRALAAHPPAGGLVAGIVTVAGEAQATVYLGQGTSIELDLEAVSWARPYLNESRRGPAPKAVNEAVKAGDIVRVTRSEDDGKWLLSQVPAIGGAIVALDPSDGAVLALSGGFDFSLSKFNRAIQAERQPGSSFKPFVYSAALEEGFSPASIVLDAPVVFQDPSLEDAWRPQNYSGRFYGPTRLREALTHSRNLVSIRLVRAIGAVRSLEHAALFGFDPARHPRNLSLALGSGSTTPYEMTAAYAVFANGGYRVEPWFIDRVEDMDGNEVFRTTPARVCEPGCPEETRQAERVISEENAFQMYSMMRDVVRDGTARRALSLGRGDIAGKTGTTNDMRDAWFSGFNRDAAASVWIGFDRHTPLGANETGGTAALPVWIDFMRVALEGRPERLPPQPPGILTTRIDAETGRPVESEAPGSFFEYFTPEQLEALMQSAAGENGGRSSTEPLF